MSTECSYIVHTVYVPPMYIKCEILPFVHELVWENDMFICSGDLFVDDDVVDAFCAVLLFGLDIFARQTLLLLLLLLNFFFLVAL